MKILVSGSLAYDRIMDFPGYFKDNILPDKIHVLNVSFNIDNLKEEFGGTAGNIAYNLALLGERPVILAAAGNDFEKYKKWLRKNRVDVSQIRIVKNVATASAHIITDQSDNQITGFYMGAMKQGLQATTYKLQPTKIAIVSPGNVEDMVGLPQLYKRHKIPYIYDPGQAINALSRRDLLTGINGAGVFISNDYELSLVLRKIGLTKKQLISKIDILVTTFGEKGSRIETQEKIYKIPTAKPKNTSDPTGAGDAYRAGLIKGLVLGWPLEKVGRLAALVSVYTVEKYGTQTHRFSWAQLAARYRQNFGEVL